MVRPELIFSKRALCDTLDLAKKMFSFFFFVSFFLFRQSKNKMFIMHKKPSGCMSTLKLNTSLLKSVPFHNCLGHHKQRENSFTWKGMRFDCVKWITPRRKVKHDCHHLQYIFATLSVKNDTFISQIFNLENCQSSRLTGNFATRTEMHSKSFSLRM